MGQNVGLSPLRLALSREVDSAGRSRQASLAGTGEKGGYLTISDARRLEKKQRKGSRLLSLSVLRYRWHF